MIYLVSPLVDEQIWRIFLKGVSSDTASSYFFRQIKARSILHHGSVGAISEENKRNLTLTLILKLLLPSIVFYNKSCVLIMIFTASSFLRLIHALFLISGGNASQTNVNLNIF